MNRDVLFIICSLVGEDELAVIATWSDVALELMCRRRVHAHQQHQEPTRLNKMMMKLKCRRVTALHSRYGRPGFFRFVSIKRNRVQVAVGQVRMFLRRKKGGGGTPYSTGSGSGGASPATSTRTESQEEPLFRTLAVPDDVYGPLLFQHLMSTAQPFAGAPAAVAPVHVHRDHRRRVAIVVAADAFEAFWYSARQVSCCAALLKAKTMCRQMTDAGDDACVIPWVDAGTHTRFLPDTAGAIGADFSDYVLDSCGIQQAAMRCWQDSQDKLSVKCAIARAYFERSGLGTPTEYLITGTDCSAEYTGLFPRDISGDVEFYRYGGKATRWAIFLTQIYELLHRPRDAYQQVHVVWKQSTFPLQTAHFNSVVSDGPKLFGHRAMLDSRIYRRYRRRNMDRGGLGALARSGRTRTPVRSEQDLLQSLQWSLTVQCTFGYDWVFPTLKVHSLKIRLRHMRTLLPLWSPESNHLYPQRFQQKIAFIQLLFGDTGISHCIARHLATCECAVPVPPSSKVPLFPATKNLLEACVANNIPSVVKFLNQALHRHPGDPVCALGAYLLINHESTVSI